MESKQSHFVNRTYGPLHKFPTELTFSLVVHQPITYPHRKLLLLFTSFWCLCFVYTLLRVAEEEKHPRMDVNNASLKAIERSLIYFFFSLAGANLRSGEVGIFPLAHVVDVEYSEFDPDVMSSLLRLSENEKKERFLLDYLGSVETSLYKGNIVLCQAVKKIYSKEEDMCQLPTVLQITEKGIKMQSKVSNQVK